MCPQIRYVCPSTNTHADLKPNHSDACASVAPRLEQLVCKKKNTNNNTHADLKSRNADIGGLAPRLEQLLRCQYLYFCTSKVVVVVKQVN